MFVSRLIFHDIILLALAYFVVCEDLIQCPDGEQGIEQTLAIICDPPEDASATVDCPFMMATNSPQEEYDSINCLKLINQGNDSEAATPSITIGGISHTYVMGDVISQAGQGVNYTLSVWSKLTTTTLPPPTTLPPITTSPTTVETETVPETTTPEVTTTNVETTTSGTVKGVINQELLIGIFCPIIIGLFV